MGTFSEDAFDFGEARIVGGDKGGPDGMRKESMRDLFGYEG